MLIRLKYTAVFPFNEYLTGLGHNRFEVARAERKKVIAVPAFRHPLSDRFEIKTRIAFEKLFDARLNFATPIQHARTTFASDDNLRESQKFKPAIAPERRIVRGRDVIVQVVRFGAFGNHFGNLMLELPVTAIPKGQMGRAIHEVE